MVEQHIASGKGVTVAALRTPIEQADQFGVIETAANGRDIAALPREAQGRRSGCPDAPDQVFASMGNYVFSTEALISTVSADAADADLQARPRRQHHPRARRAERRAGLRLLDQRGAGRDGPRPRLLARRRHARRLLRRAHGPDLGPPDLQHVQPRLADPHVARDHPAGQVHLRRGRPPRPGDRLDGVRRRGHLRRHRAPLDPLAARARALVLAGRGLDPHARASRSPATRSCARAILDKNVYIGEGVEIGVDPEKPTASASTSPRAGSS